MRRRVVLVNPPFQPLTSPSTGLSYIYSTTRGAGHEARVADLNYPLAEWLLPTLPRLAQHWDASYAAHAGQLVFSALAFPEHRSSAALAAAIRTVEVAHGIQFDVLLEDVRRKVDEWIAEQRFTEADVVAFTFLNYQLLAGLYLIDRVRACAPRARIVVGGFYVSADNGVALMRQSSAIDFCVHGEGEKTFLELLDKLDRPESWETILGIVYRDARGAPTPSPARPLMTGAELDALPFPSYDWIRKDDFDRYKLSIPVVSIRGCYWGKCTFCSDFRFNKTTYARSPESVVAEMEWQAQEHGTSRFYFADLATNDTIERVRRIADRLAASRYRFEFTMLFVPDNVDLAMLRSLKAAGCKAVQYGIESFSNSLLKKMAKSPRAFENVRAIKLTELAGMQALSNIIKFFPTETPEEVIDNYEVIARYPELLNGYVFARPVQFRSRDGATINKLLARRSYEALDRAIHHHYWPEEWSKSIPDIEYMVEVRSSNRMLHEHLWREIDELLEANMERRSLARFEDDGEILRLSKYSHRAQQQSIYELRGLGRSLYLLLEDEVTVDVLRERLGVGEQELASALDYLLEEALILRDGDRVIAAINPNVAEIELDPLITTVENRERRRRADSAQCVA